MQTIEEVKEHCRFVRQGVRFAAAVLLAAVSVGAKAEGTAGMNWADLYRKDPKTLLEEQIRWSHAKNNELVFLQAKGEKGLADFCTPEYMLEFYRAKKMEEALKSKDPTAVKKMAEVIIKDLLLSQELYQGEEKLVKLIRDCTSSESKFAVSRTKIKKLADRINEIKTSRMKTWYPDGLKSSK